MARPGAMPGSTEQARLPVLVWTYLLLVIIPIGVQVGPLFLTGLRLFLMIMIIPLLLRLFSGQCGRVYPTDVLFVCHLIWATLALLVNNPGDVIEQTGSVGIEFLGGYAIGRALIRTRDHFIALAKVLVVIVFVMMPFAVFETLTGRPLWIEALQAIPGVRTVTDARATARDLFGVTLERVQLGFAHPIHFGLFCAVTFSLCFVGLKGTVTDIRRWIAGIFLAATACLALSSGAILAIALQMGLIMWERLFQGINSRWWWLLGASTFAYVIVDVLSNRTPIEVFMSYATFSAHTAYWRALIFEWGMVNVWQHPVFGLGINDWVRPGFMYSDSIDNFWLLNAMRYGIPGFLFLAAGYLWVLVDVMRLHLETDHALARLRRAFVFTFMGLSFTLFTVHVWTAIFSFTFFLLGAGVWMLSADQTQAAAPRPPQPRSHHRTFARGLANDQDQGDTTAHSARRFTRFAHRAETEQCPHQKQITRH